MPETTSRAAKNLRSAIISALMAACGANREGSHVLSHDEMRQMCLSLYRFTECLDQYGGGPMRVATLKQFLREVGEDLEEKAADDRERESRK